jgi:hypothetical protein
MAFNTSALEEKERRTYSITMWSRKGEIITPKAGIIDSENDIRLFCYGNGQYREASDEYQFIFDYKGIVMNVNVGEKIKDFDVCYSLIEIDGEKELITEEMKRSLSDAIRFYCAFKWNIKDNRVVVHTEF